MRRIYRLESTVSRKGPYHSWEGEPFDTSCLRAHEVPMRKGWDIILGGRVCGWSTRFQMYAFPRNLGVFCNHGPDWKILELEIHENDIQESDDGQVVFFRETATVIRTFELREFFEQPLEFYHEEF